MKVDSNNAMHFYKLEVNTGIMKLRELFSLKLGVSGRINRSTFVRIGGFYFIFYLDVAGVKKCIAKERKFSNILLEETICEPDKYNPFTNLKLFHQPTLNRILVTASCTK